MNAWEDLKQEELLLPLQAGKEGESNARCEQFVDAGSAMVRALNDRILAESQISGGAN